MKNISEQIHNLDRENFRRVAHGLPEVQDDNAPARQQQVAEVFNSLFSQLRATFPAAIANFRTQDEFDEFRRQWLLAFSENGITTLSQVAAGSCCHDVIDGRVKTEYSRDELRLMHAEGVMRTLAIWKKEGLVKA